MYICVSIWCDLLFNGRQCAIFKILDSVIPQSVSQVKLNCQISQQKRKKNPKVSTLLYWMYECSCRNYMQIICTSKPDRKPYVSDVCVTQYIDSTRALYIGYVYLYMCVYERFDLDFFFRFIIGQRYHALDTCFHEHYSVLTTNMNV